jgi:hypothetical protein
VREPPRTTDAGNGDDVLRRDLQFEQRLFQRVDNAVVAAAGTPDGRNDALIVL